MYVHTRVRERRPFRKISVDDVGLRRLRVRVDGSGKRVNNVNGHAWVDGD